MRIGSLLTAVTLLSMAPVTSFAAIQCSYICDGGNCDQRCSDGIVPTTCRGAGYCFDPAPESISSASVTTEEALRAEDSAPVCSEEHPETARSATAES